MQSLIGSDFEWLYDLLQNLGHGRIVEFGNSVSKHDAAIKRFPNIVTQLTHLAQKVRIISFLELLFEVDKDERSLPFHRIANHCILEITDVELLIMKAMSLGLVKGTIDEVEQVVHVDWMMPRYLSKAHLEIMARKLRDWENKVEGVVKQMEQGSEELRS